MSSLPTVTVAIIAKDEAAVIGRCVGQLAGAVDEIIVVDTGSTDHTVAIAASQGALLRSYPWRDDFAAARQFAFDLATSDWVCWLDADDVVNDPMAIRGSIAAAGDWPGAIAWRYILNRDEAGEPGFTYWRERCVRTDGSFRWVGRVHEVLVGPPGREPRYDESVSIDHRPDAAKAATKSGRNLRILAREYEEHNGQIEPRQLFYLAREYLDHGDNAQGQKLLTEYLAVGAWRDERYIALTLLADLQAGASDWTAATATCLQAVQEWPLRPEAYFSLARYAYLRRSWDEVVHWVEAGRRLPLPDTVLFVDQAALKFGWIIYYTNALYWQGRLAEAAEWTARGLADDPGNTWHLTNQALFRRILASGQVPLTRSTAPLVPTYPVIPVRDQHDMTDTLLDQLGLPPDRIYLIDNGSVEPAAPRFAGRAQVISSPKRNISALWNLGLDAVAAREPSAHNVAVLNNDLTVGREFLPALANALRARSNRLISYPDLDGGLPPGWTDPDGRMTGYAFMLRGEAGLRADTQFVWWYGDDDLARRARRQGEVVRVGGLTHAHLAPSVATYRDPGLVAQTERDEAAYRARWGS